MLTVVIAGCVVVLACGSVVMWMSKMRSEFRAQLGSLSAAVRTLQFQRDAADRIAPVDTSPTEEIPRLEIAAAKANPIALLLPPDQKSTAVSPETQVMIKAALSALLGHEVQIRSVELLETPDVAAAWATQGRIAIQASHNQRTSRG